jgi:hypothetical protein
MQVSRRNQQAIDFQAFGAGTLGHRPHSNIVRVAWAGGQVKTWSGTWHVSGSGYSGNYVLTQTGNTVTGTCNWLGWCDVTGTLSGNTWKGTSTPRAKNLTVSTFTFTLSSDGGSFSGGGRTATGSGWSESATCVAGPCTGNE